MSLLFQCPYEFETRCVLIDTCLLSIQAFFFPGNLVAPIAVVLLKCISNSFLDCSRVPDLQVKAYTLAALDRVDLPYEILRFPILISVPVSIRALALFKLVLFSGARLLLSLDLVLLSSYGSCMCIRITVKEMETFQVYFLQESVGYGKKNSSSCSRWSNAIDHMLSFRPLRNSEGETIASAILACIGPQSIDTAKLDPEKRPLCTS